MVLGIAKSRPCVGAAAYGLVLTLCSGPTRAHGQDSQDSSQSIGRRIVVLDVDPTESPGPTATALLSELRQAMQRVTSWKEATNHAGTRQIAIMYGCVTALDAPCLRRISRGFRAQGVFGASIIPIEQEHAKSTHYKARLKLFLLPQSAEDPQYTLAHHLIPKLDSSGKLNASQRIALERWLAVQARTTSRLSISGLGTKHTLALDGETYAVPRGRTHVQIPNLTPGTHELRLAAPDHITLVKQFRLHPSTELRLEASSRSPPARSPPAGAKAARSPAMRIAGWSSVGLSAVFMGLTAYSLVRVARINNDPLLEDYRAQAPSSVGDVCASPRPYGPGGPSSPENFGEVVSLCDEVKRQESLRWVFAGLSAASAITGLTLLLVDRSKRSARGQSAADREAAGTAGLRTFELRALGGPHSALLRARLQW